MAEPNGVQGDGTQNQGSNLLQRAGGHFQGKTVSGLLELLPILVPIVVIVYVVNLADSAIIPMLNTITRELSGGTRDFPNFWGTGLIVAIVLFYLVGLMTSTRAGKAVMGFVTDVMGSIPVVKGILGVTRQATTVMTSQFNFSRVVFLEWPREGMIALGFVTARILKADSELSLAIVYIPTVPNPTSGNMAVVSEDELFETDITVEDAMKLVFSGGIVPPDSISLGRIPLEYRVNSEIVGRFDTDR
ncbi:MAG: DUF502 domain-containing protein [Dehalococcoidia bacterium]|nr:DUF502 domain-containing protein [Dehalococcoidia bacterium]